MTRKLVWGAVFAVCCGTFAAAEDKPPFEFNHPAMGTTYSLFLYADTHEQAAQEAEKAFEIVDDVDALLSNYKPQSELSRINRDAFSTPVTTDPETFRFLEASRAWSERSDGAFDITVGKLMKAWGFYRHSGHIPSDAELKTVQAQTGWQNMHLAPADRSVRFTAKDLELDPGGIGKGFAVDEVVTLLRSDGITAALVSAGSSTIYALGAPPSESGWKVNVPDPRHPGATLAEVMLRDTSLSTASCAEKHFILNGHLYCHIMDPRLGIPVEGRLQATVITPVATDGDALSNVMFVDEAKARGEVMRQLPATDSAIVFSGTPQTAGTTCDSYRWPGTLPAICHPASADHALPLKETK